MEISLHIHLNHYGKVYQVAMPFELHLHLAFVMRVFLVILECFLEYCLILRGVQGIIIVL